MAADRVSSASRTRTLPPRPPGPPAPGRTSSSSSKQPQTGSMLNISKMSSGKMTGSSRSQERHDPDLFYSSDSELGGTGGRPKEQQKIVKRNNSQMRHKSESKPAVVLRNGEYFEHVDSGWTSRDSSSMDRSSSVSLEEKMDDLELTPGHNKLRKSHDMRSELNLTMTQAQFVGFGLLPDQVYNKAVRKGFEFSLMVVGELQLC